MKEQAYFATNCFPFYLQVSKLEKKEGISVVEDVDWFIVLLNCGN